MWQLLFWFGRQLNKLDKFKWWKKKYRVHFRTSRKIKRENFRFIDELTNKTIKGS